jgi:catechol 2,3-dioxygenase-like lactoylglutathione lyase family enzyme
MRVTYSAGATEAIRGAAPTRLATARHVPFNRPREARDAAALEPEAARGDDAGMTGLLVNIDVDDLERGVDFYCRALGLRLARRLFDGSVAELAGAPVPIQLLVRPAGSPTAGTARSYDRHWTPVHVDVTVDDVDTAVARAVAAGARLEGRIQDYAWGRLAEVRDPFGHGLCLLELRGGGYDLVTDAPSGGTR